jgi:hypothetical protein
MEATRKGESRENRRDGATPRFGKRLQPTQEAEGKRSKFEIPPLTATSERREVREATQCGQEQRRDDTAHMYDTLQCFSAMRSLPLVHRCRNATHACGASSDDSAARKGTLEGTTRTGEGQQTHTKGSAYDAPSIHVLLPFVRAVCVPLLPLFLCASSPLLLLRQSYRPLAVPHTIRLLRPVRIRMTHTAAPRNACLLSAVCT